MAAGQVLPGLRIRIAATERVMVIGRAAVSTFTAAALLASPRADPVDAVGRSSVAAEAGVTTGESLRTVDADTSVALVREIGKRAIATDLAHASARFAAPGHHVAPDGSLTM